MGVEGREKKERKIDGEADIHSERENEKDAIKMVRQAQSETEIMRKRRD